MLPIRLITFVLGFATIIQALPADEKVDSLPEMDPFDKYGLYSGYVPLGNTTKTIHYLFVQSQQDTNATDPLILWYNGGPGCSSMLAFATEHGPWVLPDGETNFTANPFSWNREANVLYVEQPAGVGFSYCDNDKHPEDCTFNDTTAAADNLAFLLAWYEKYPEYQKNDLYVSGESYAGIYVPYLVSEIYDQNQNTTGFKIPIKGMMVGNGVTNWEYDTYPAFIEMAYYHSLYSDELYESMVFASCNYSYFLFDPEISRVCDAYYGVF